MELVLYSVPIAMLIVALVELVKRTANLDARWAPLLALMLGLAFAVAGKLDSPDSATWLQAALLGLLTGLSAAGLYSGAKATAGQ